MVLPIRLHTMPDIGFDAFGWELLPLLPFRVIQVKLGVIFGVPILMEIGTVFVLRDIGLAEFLLTNFPM